MEEKGPNSSIGTRPLWGRWAPALIQHPFAAGKVRKNSTSAPHQTKPNNKFQLHFQRKPYNTIQD